METKRAANREMRRRDTRRKGDRQNSKKSRTAELVKREKKTRLKKKSYCPQKKHECSLPSFWSRQKTVKETVQRREEAEKKPKKRTEAVRVIMAHQALGDWVVGEKVFNETKKCFFKMQEIWVGLKWRAWGPWEECVQMITEVVSSKTGERKVGIDGVRDVDRSLWGRQKKRAHEEGISSLFFYSWHWKDTADYRFMSRILRHSVMRREAWWVHEVEKREKRLRDWEQNWMFPTILKERRRIREDLKNQGPEDVDPHRPDDTQLWHFLPLLAAGLFSAAIYTGQLGLE